MTTHRVIQIAHLMDSISAKSRQARRAAHNLTTINNFKGEAAMLAKAVRYERIASTCERLLARDKLCLDNAKAMVHWNALAEIEENLGKFNEKSGNRLGHSDTNYHNAGAYRNAAKSIFIGMQTGVPVCSCCFEPIGKGVSFL